jgi:glyoxylase-like metal-dependent hydrolase (beta-lactamase superfamily II)
LEAEFRAHAGRFVVVDEGPGLSGSSFAGTADALERLGVAPDRIAFLPGHGGDLGPEAAPAAVARWRTAGARWPISTP